MTDLRGFDRCRVTLQLSRQESVYSQLLLSLFDLRALELMRRTEVLKGDIPALCKVFMPAFLR